VRHRQRIGRRLLTFYLLGGCGGQAASAPAPPDAGQAQLRLSSPAFTEGGSLPPEYTCDGTGTSPPLEWTGVPSGTRELALLVTTVAKDGLKWNWVLWAIPPETPGLSAGSGVGTAGLTSDGPALAYSPPCSQGPGAKTYTFTLYALSDHPTLPARPREVTGAALTDAIRASTIAKSELDVSYAR